LFFTKIGDIIYVLIRIYNKTHEKADKAMQHQNELEFLLDTFKKSRLKASFTEKDGTPLKEAQSELERLLEGGLPRGITELRPEPKTVYKFTDGFGLKYKYMLLSQDDGRIFTVGPYVSSAPSQSMLLEIGERNQVSPKQQRYLAEYYDSLPHLQDSSQLFTMLDTFLERVWEQPSFAIIDRKDSGSAPSPINESESRDGFDDILINMKAMEKRYEFENGLMEAVSLGQLHKEGQLLGAFSGEVFEKRVADPMRNVQNYCIIMNTLLRKAAERGGVHPLYLDRVSSEYALKIEQLGSVENSKPLMCEMFRAYCRLVRKHSIKGYSLLVQKTVVIIDSDLSANLQLSSLAAIQGVSAGYLSSMFRREVGKTVSEYIREKRVRHAAHLLATTQLQIQTVALHCGILDVQYFSKIFKRETGKTPKEYRELTKSARRL